ncbi:MAG: hypothetical protein H6713_11050 [Myxococcales bacterium]|nr:hypothetical protein [Myxococcales bacterium]MCB9750511.1 hypothetical protein [Myxococcales bacterium]
MIERQLAVLLVSAGMILAPLPAHAAPAEGAAAASADGPSDETREQARQLFINGQRLYAEGSYEAAIIAFKKGYELSQEPAFLYNIANAYERLGEFGQARDYYDQYRVYADEGQQDALSRKIAVLDKRQSEKLAEEQADKERAAAAAREEERRRQEQLQADQKPKEKVFGPAAWALTATAAIGFGIGIGFGVRANNKRDEALANCVGETEMRVCSSAAQEAIDARRQAAIGADVGFVVGAVSTVALIGVVAAAAAKKARSEKGGDASPADAKAARRPRVAPFAGRSGGGLVLSGRF